MGIEWDLFPYTIPLWLGLFALIFTAAKINQKDRLSSGPISLVLLVVAFWLFGYTLELLSATIEVKRFWDAFQTIYGMLGAAVLYFTLDYTGRAVSNWTRLALLVEPVIAWSLAITNPELLHINSRLSTAIAPLSVLVYDFGPLGLFDSIAGYGFSLASIALLIRHTLASRALVRRQSIILIVCITIPMLVALLPVIGIVPPHLDDTSMLLFVLTSVILVGTLFRFRLGYLFPVTRETIADHLSDGVLVLNEGGLVIDINQAARDLLMLSDKTALGGSLARLLPTTYTRHLPFGRRGEPALMSIEITLPAKQAGAEQTSESIFDLRLIPLKPGKGQTLSWLAILHDLTAIKHIERELRDSEERLKAMFDHHSAMMYTIEPDSLRLLSVNQSALRFYGYSSAQMLTMRIPDLNPLPEAQNHPEVNGAGTAARQYYTAKHRLANGELRDVEIYSSPIHKNGKPEFFFAIVNDITERKRNQAELHHLATTDPLTDLLNRRYFYDLARQQLEESQRYRRPLAAIMLDIDHFKGVNDGYGHTTGDQVLIAVANIIRANLRGADIAARYGGEEFVVLMPETDAAGALLAAERLRDRLAAFRLDSGRGQVAISASLGVAATRGEPAFTVDHLLDQADQALYTAKLNGRNRVEQYGGV